MNIPSLKKTSPGGHEIYNFSRLSFGYPYCILSFSDPCLGVEKKIFKGVHLKTILNAYSLFDLHGHALAQKSLPWDHEIYNFGRAFLGYH